MILPIHIIIAVASMVAAGLAYFYPTQTKLRISYSLIAMTFASGFYLIYLIKPDHWAQVCITGLAYLAITVSATIAARHKLAQTIQSKNWDDKI